MEFLFTNQTASVEAIMFFFCIAIIASIFLYDALRYCKRLYFVFHPRKSNTRNNILDPVAISPSPIPPELELPQVPGDETHLPEALDPSTWEEEIPSLTVEEILTHDEITMKEESEIIPVEVISPFLEEPIVPSESLDTREALPEEMSEPKEEMIEPYKETMIWDIPPQEEEEKSTIEVIPTPEKKIESPREALIPQKIEEAWIWTKKSEKIESDMTSVHASKREKITTIVNTAHTLIARGHIEDARSTIINGLALDKDHRELNILMASLYERDHDYTKSEYIFKDLARLYPDDAEILDHLATSLAMQNRYEVSYELYKKVLALSGENEDILYTLTHLSSELSLPEEVYKYAKSYLKQYPKNPEILWLYSQALITKSERREAIETLIKLKNLTPYNQEIVDLIGKLVTEEELAGNFGGEK